MTVLRRRLNIIALLVRVCSLTFMMEVVHCVYLLTWVSSITHNVYSLEFPARHDGR